MGDTTARTRWVFDRDVARQSIARVLLFVALFVLAVLACSTTARASGDYGCSTTWTLTRAVYSDCDNSAVLAPGNDTRVNLVLLTDGKQVPPADPARPEEALFGWGDVVRRYDPPRPGEADNYYFTGAGSRCISNEQGAEEFAGAIGTARWVAAADRDILIAARRSLKPDCDKQLPVPFVVPAVTSAEAQPFARYLAGASAFYAGDFDAAQTAFAETSRARDDWLRDTGRYMLARVALNRAQVDTFDQYGALVPPVATPNATEAPALTQARGALQAYLEAYPRGRHAASARGLMRRVDWLGNRRDRLASEYARLMVAPQRSSAPDARDMLTDVELAQEIDNKLLIDAKPGDIRDPLLLAVVDLQRMRTGDGLTPITRAELEAQRPLFARAPDLFGHLLATHALYVAKTPAEVLRLIPEARAGDAVGFSRQMLRAAALQVTGDAGTRAHLLRLLPQATRPFERPAVELAIAFHDERAGAVERVFAPDSPVRNATLRGLLLTNVADPVLLRQQATNAATPLNERSLALFTLLYKSLTRGRYDAFVRDVALVPARELPGEADHLLETQGSARIFTTTGKLGDYGCPALRVTAATLATNAADAQGQLCVAEFVRVNDLDGFVLDRPPSADQLGGTASRFAGKAYSRLETYKRIIARPGTNARSGDDRTAFALHRAVRCYAPGGNNQCGGDDVDKSVRRGWFTRLKRDFSGSRWARDLQYYW